MGKESHTNNSPSVCSTLVVDCVVTSLYRTIPLIGLITRKKYPYADRYCLPGGHFDAGVWNQEKQCFEMNSQHGCDLTIEQTASRELAEEAMLCVSPDEWQFLMFLTAPNRDPRPDMRRLSAVFWKDFSSFSSLLLGKANSDAASWTITNLMSLTEEVMGFDHWLVIQKLQKHWAETARTWSFDGFKYVHKCNELFHDFGEIWRHPNANEAYHSHSHNTILQPIKFCPGCGKSLTLPIINS